MRIPLSWLKEFIDIKMSVEEMANLLTTAGLEVENIEEIKPSFEGVVVGKVESAQPHPDADRLRVAVVTDGRERYTVVCGAPNCREGIFVAFARIGACLTDEDGKAFKIKKTKLRGVESSGMLCSGKELRLSEDAEGIVELPSDLALGSDYAVSFRDTVFEIGLTPNLAHCMSVLGVARELSAMTGIPLRQPAATFTEVPEEVFGVATVVVADKALCPRYTCRVMKGVTVGVSPAWLQRRLELCGVRSINNVVDATNYVLLERGHPLHAFDYDKVVGRVEVRRAHEAEHLVTLDGVDRALNHEHLVIADAEKALALAGVMGGLDSEVTPSTKNLLIESAYFQRENIRRTSRALNLITDAAQHFDKGADPNNVIISCDRVVGLIQQLAGGGVCRGIIDVKDHAFPEKVVTCRLKRINALLGTHLSMGEVEKIFEQLGFPVTCDAQEVFTVTVPTFRGDIDQEVDLIEEVARVYGYNNIPRVVASYHASVAPHSPIYVCEQEVRRALLAQGLQEFVSNDLISPVMAAYVPDSAAAQQASVTVMNPISSEQSVLRTSLLPPLLQVVKYNLDHGVKDIHGFEIGRSYGKREKQYLEQTHVAIIMTGKRAPYAWDGQNENADFFDVKGIVENLLHAFGIEEVVFTAGSHDVFHTGRQAEMWLKESRLGVVGEVHPSICRKLDIPQKVFFAEINVHDLMRLKKERGTMAPLPEFPGTYRDWTVPVPEAMPVGAIMAALREKASRLVEEVAFLAVYRGEKAEEGKKNVTFRMLYRDPSKTLEQEAVEKEHAKLVEAVREKLSL